MKQTKTLPRRNAGIIF